MPDVRLREWRREDVAEVAVMAEDPHVRRWSTLAEDLEAWIEAEIAQERGPTRAICLHGDDRARGRVALRMPEHASAAVRCEAMRPEDQPAGELSYWVLPAARGLGLATAAVRAMLSLIAERTALRSVVLDIEVDNQASIRVAQRLGAERRVPERVAVDRTGEPRTLAVFVLAVER
jgi:ribosomal-protein-alanine N-acetyltransferase